MATILDFYKYAALATASYVRMGSTPLTGEDLAREANAQEGGRLPLVLGTALFNPADANAPRWNVLHYYGGDVPATQDPIAAQDSTGFGATLFERSGEKVLALRGTEPSLDGSIDLAEDLAGIGVLGIALAQVVSMVNLIERLKAPLDVDVVQLKLHLTLTNPGGQSVEILVKDGQSVRPGYIHFTTDTARGLGAIGATEKITVTGHSLGGHLAVMAGWLYPTLVKPDVYVYNSPGFNPNTTDFGILRPFIESSLRQIFGPQAPLPVSTPQQKAAPLINLIGQYLNAAPDLSGLRIQNLESEDLAPGNDVSVVSSGVTGSQNLGPEILVPRKTGSDQRNALIR